MDLPKQKFLYEFGFQHDIASEIFVCVCVCVCVFVLWFWFVPLFGSAAIPKFLNSGPN